MGENKPKIFVISGPSGSGKGTLVEKLLEKDKNVVLSVSSTTRKPRAGEQEGVDYYFIKSPKEFCDKAKSGKFLEWARVHNNYYGTSLNEVEEKLKLGKDIILEIDPQGAFQVKDKKLDTVLIFIMPPSIEDLKKRLKKRATEDDNVIEKRIVNASEEIDKAKNYDYVIINKDLDKASSELVNIIHKERAK